MYGERLALFFYCYLNTSNKGGNNIFEGDIMRDEIELLEYIFQNSKIGVENIMRIRKERKKSDELDEVLKDMVLNYRKIANASRTMIERRTKKTRDISILSKLATYMNVKLNGINEDSISSVATILIQASTIGKTEILDRIDEYRVKSKNVENVANRLIQLEEQNIERLNLFLKQ